MNEDENVLCIGEDQCGRVSVVLCVDECIVLNECG